MTAILPDVLCRDLRIVFCGTAVGRTSAERQAYYARPGNAFWGTIFEVGLTPRLFRPDEYHSLVTLGLGFTDLAKLVAGNDSALCSSDFGREELTTKILRFRPRIVAFTSKRAAEEFVGRQVNYGILRERVRDSLLFALPSPSGAARRYWNPTHWQALAKLASNMPPAKSGGA